MHLIREERDNEIYFIVIVPKSEPKHKWNGEIGRWEEKNLKGSVFDTLYVLKDLAYSLEMERDRENIKKSQRQALTEMLESMK